MAAKPFTLSETTRRGNHVKKYVLSVEHSRAIDGSRGATCSGTHQLGRIPRRSAVRSRQSGRGLVVEGGVKLPLALAELGLIDEYEFVVHPRVAGHGPTLFAGLSKRLDLKLVSRLEFGSGAVAMRYVPRW